MNLNKRKNAFSLTELLIVLVIIAILFAAMAPIITKRRNGSTTANEPVWSFVAADEQKDAYYDPGAAALTSTAFIGVNPRDLTNNLRPYSKVVLKAKTNQDFIQFRQGTGNGNFVGKFALNDSRSIYNTTRLNGSQANNYAVSGGSNTAAGIGAFTKYSVSEANTAIGFNSMYGDTTRPGAQNVSVGLNTGQYVDSSSNNNIFIGSNNGKGKGTNTHNVAVGTGVLGLDNSAGDYNVLLGYYVASVGMNSTDSDGNVIVASNYYGNSTKNNTIIGVDTYPAGNKNHNAANITAVGAGACDSMIDSPASSANPGSRTCIGVNSARGSGSGANKTPDSFETDQYDHIFIGGQPHGFGGRSVLEVHNINSKSNLSAKPNVGPTVVLNSNLVVRGNLYFPSVVDGSLGFPLASPFYNSTGEEQSKDFCSKGCCLRVFRRYKCYEWRKRKGCNIIGDIFHFILSPIDALVHFITGWTTAWSWVVDAFKASSDGRSRSKDPETTGAFFMNYSDATTKCDGAGKASCPQLKISDIRLKDVLSQNIEALNLITNVVPYNYTFKSDVNAVPQVGVMAQDLQKYSPNSVTEGADGYLSIRWDEMFYAAINATKELANRADKLSDDVKELENDTANVDDTQKAMKDRIAGINKRIDKLEK